MLFELHLPALRGEAEGIYWAGAHCESESERLGASCQELSAVGTNSGLVFSKLDYD